MSNVQEFGAKGDGKTVDTRAIQHAAKTGDGLLHFPKGTYILDKTIEISATKNGPVGIDGSHGTARVLMVGGGPAFRVVGSHGGTGDPSTLKPVVWNNERMPTIQNIVIEGRHAEADGVQMLETMQCVFEGVLIRRVRHGIHLHRRNRNVLISHCHIYFNSGVGVFLDRVNLHQINIASNHISYNRLGGIRLQGSEVRNLQITGNDIEYNNHAQHRTKPEPTAEIYVDVTQDGDSVNEITVASNTIQATSSPGGANIRIIEDRKGRSRPPGLWTITGNIIGSQENNVHLTGCHGMVISGNSIYSCDQYNILAKDCDHRSICGNSFRRHTGNKYAGVRLEHSRNCTVQGCVFEDESKMGQASKKSLLELDHCKSVTVSGCQVIGGVPYGIHAQNSSMVNISGCSIHDPRAVKKTKAGIVFAGSGKANLVALNTIGKDSLKPILVSPKSNVKLHENVIG